MGGLTVFLLLPSSGEDGIQKSPNPFGCDFQCIQLGLGFLPEFLIFFVQCFKALLPNGRGLFCGGQFLFQPPVVRFRSNAIDCVLLERGTLLRCERNISGEGIFLAHCLDVLYRQRSGFGGFGFLLQNRKPFFGHRLRICRSSTLSAH